ncbi:rhomboid family intramembrane serine protease [Acinetobacter sp. WZC-1]|uniref:rhomboid family intramembrane serine protease n=1 Tax=Acinetobacter sp. WZC-1 TaxID=3459034 RepID=UPI00403DBD01
MSELQPPQVHTRQRQPIGQITLLLIILNVGLFAWQILSGVDITSPSTMDAIRWGADYAPLTYSEEPYRLFSSMFFHFGLIHLMFNMWALYIFGNIAEQTFGRFYYLGLYLLAGFMGGLLSGYLDIRNSHQLLQHFDPALFPRVSAGASGAVMGLGGALTALSFFAPLPRQRFILDKKALIIIMIINLAFGFFATGINNSAHVGGMLMGVILAISWYFLQRSQRSNPGGYVLVLLLAAGLCYAFYQYSLSLLPPIAPLWQETIHQLKSLTGR